MTIVKVKKLSRRCLVIIAAALVTGCATAQQMPSAIEEGEVTKVVDPQVVQEDRLTDLLPFLEVSVQENIASEKPTDIDPIIKHISETWKVSPVLAAEIVALADKNAFEDFPKRNDLLAIMAVESSFNPKASYKGSYGLMQIEKKSHLSKLAGRNILNVAVNIEIGAKVLNEYFNSLRKNIRSTLLSYNAGIGSFMKGRFKLEYYKRYKTQLALLEKVQ